MAHMTHLHRSLALLSFVALTGFGATTHFSDVTQSHEKTAVEFLRKQNIIEGYSDGTFRPKSGINRVEFLTIIQRLLSEQSEGVECDASELPFTDTDSEAWYAPALCEAFEAGVIKGYPDGTARPAQMVNIAEAAAIVDRMFFEPSEEEVDPAEPWYTESILALLDAGALPQSILSLDRPLTRGEMAEIMYRLETDQSFLPSAEYEDLLPELFDSDGSSEGEEEDEEFISMSPEDCEEDEQYDEEGQFCYVEIECDSDEECEAISNDLEQETQEILQEGEDFQELPDPEEGGDEEAIARYAVSGDALTQIKSSTAPDAWMAEKRVHEEVWKLFARMIPESARVLLGAYEVVTDGKQGTMAAVYQDESLPGEKNWVLQIDIADAYSDAGKTLEREELLYTLIHEYAHLMTLHAGQMQSVSSCPTYQVDEGCTKRSAYLNAFYEKFWKDLSPSGEGSDDLYEHNASSFVSDYAATNVAEDIAESFASFVLREPKGSSVADEKIRFFRGFGELLELRSVILSRLK